MESLTGVVTWPYLPAALVIGYLVVVIVLAGALVVTAVRALTRRA